MSWQRRSFLRAMAGTGLGMDLSRALAPEQSAALSSGGPLPCHILDPGVGQKAAARIRLVDVRGNEVVPLGHPAALASDLQEGDVRFQSRRFAYVDGDFQVDPAWLPLKYQVIKGYEYVIAEGELRGSELRAGAFTIPLSRWSSLAARGWYSGDIHIHHIAPKTCRLEMDAEDLNVANILTSDFTVDQRQFEGGVNAYSSGQRLVYVNQEFRNDQLGHLCLLNLKRLIEPVKPMQHTHYPLHLDVCDQVRRQGGYVSWAHFPSWPGVESPLDVAMEKLDGLEILCVLEPRSLPIFMRQLVPEMPANHGLRLWYRYLNCGFRLTATAGTDKMTTFVTVGANRVFAKVDGDFSYAGWIAALKAGRTFVTNSPLLTFTVDGREAGAVLQLDSRRNKAVEVHATAESQLPYDRLEIVANGEVIGEATPGGKYHRAEIHLEYPVRRSCWFAARAYERMEPYQARGIDFARTHADDGTLVSSYYGTRRPETVFAHSSPVYLIRDGQPIRNWEDARYFIRYMDNAIEWMKTQGRFANARDKEASIRAFETGRAVYRKRAGEE